MMELTTKPTMWIEVLVKDPLPARYVHIGSKCSVVNTASIVSAMSIVSPQIGPNNTNVTEHATSGAAQ